MEGTSCPLLLQTQGPLWYKCALEDTIDATIAASDELETFLEQLERVIPGSPDLSNRATFELTKTQIDYAEEDQEGTQMICTHLVALKPVNFSA